MKKKKSAHKIPFQLFQTSKLNVSKKNNKTDTHINTTSFLHIRIFQFILSNMSNNKIKSQFQLTK